MPRKVKDDETGDLFPEKPLKFRNFRLKLALVRPFTSPEPADWLVESAKRIGIFMPVVVTQASTTVGEDGGAGGFHVEAGKRRIKAAVKAGLTEVPALLLESEGYVDARMITLIENHQREENLVGSLTAMNDLIKGGASFAEIQKTLGLPDREFQPMTKLLALNADIQEGWAKGQVKMTVAQRIAKLPKSSQDALALRLGEKGKLIGADVDAAFEKPAKRQQETLPVRVKDATVSDVNMATLPAVLERCRDAIYETEFSIDKMLIVKAINRALHHATGAPELEPEAAWMPHRMSEDDREGYIPPVVGQVETIEEFEVETSRDDPVLEEPKIIDPLEETEDAEVDAEAETAGVER